MMQKFGANEIFVVSVSFFVFRYSFEYDTDAAEFFQDARFCIRVLYRVFFSSTNNTMRWKTCLSSAYVYYLIAFVFDSITSFAVRRREILFEDFQNKFSEKR